MALFDMSNIAATHDIDDIAVVETVMRYHERTKHRFNRYADGPRQLDWANQPNPFRRFEGAPLVHLPLLGAREAPLSPRYDDLYRRGSVPSADVTIHALSRLLQYALAISAWKQAGATRWALRCNPSSGNLHPTEGYLLIDALPGLADAPGLYHYAPREHGLERRAHCSAQLFKALMSELPAQAFLVGFSSIHWREAWKYGERAFRYCQHDAGHAIGALRIAAATLGWGAWLLNGLADATIEDLLGLNRAEDFALAEREHPDAVLAVWPTDLAGDGPAGVQRKIPTRLDPALAHQLTRSDLVWRRQPAHPRRPGTLGGHRRGRLGRTQTGQRGALARRPRSAGGREQWSRERRRPAGRADHPAAAKPAGLRRPDVDHGRPLLSDARAVDAGRRAASEPAPDALGRDSLGSDHPPRLVRSSGRRTRARAVPARSRPAQDGPSKSRDACTVRVVDAAGLSG